MLVIELLLCVAAFVGALVLLAIAGIAFCLLTEQPERFLSDPEHRRGFLLRT
jgi:hypothetical protein